MNHAGFIDGLADLLFLTTPKPFKPWAGTGGE
jgi:hypothetical protein